MKNLKYYTLKRSEIFSLINLSSKSILEVGCAYGALGEAIKLNNPEVVLHGIEINPEAQEHLVKNYDKFYIADVETFDLNNFNRTYDSIIYADVLEHTRNPDLIVAEHLHFLNEDGEIIISVPNIRNIRIIYELLVNGNWSYTESGILDSTHYKFFTKKTLITLINRLGLKIISINANREAYSHPIAKVASFILGLFCSDLLVCQWILKVRKK